MEIRAARWIAVGMTSLEDWPMLTWSLGWTGLLAPSSPPRIWMARLEITSLAFMLVEVPEPVWKMSRTKCVVQSPVDDLLGGLHDGVLLLLVYQAELVVDDGCLQLDRPERLDEAARLAQVAYGEVVEGAAGLGAEEGVARYLDLPHRVSLYAVRRLLLSHAKPPLRTNTSAPDSHIIPCTTVALYER